MFDRNKSANMSSFFTEPDIIEANEEEEEVAAVPSSYKLPELTDLESAKLMSCVEAVKNVIGETLPESELNKKIIEFNYNTEAVLNSILNDEIRSNKGFIISHPISLSNFLSIHSTQSKRLLFFR